MGRLDTNFDQIGQILVYDSKLEEMIVHFG